MCITYKGEPLAEELRSTLETGMSYFLYFDDIEKLKDIDRVIRFLSNFNGSIQVLITTNTLEMDSIQRVMLQYGNYSKLYLTPLSNSKIEELISSCLASLGLTYTNSRFAELLSFVSSGNLKLAIHTINSINSNISQYIFNYLDALYSDIWNILNLNDHKTLFIISFLQGVQYPHHHNSALNQLLAWTEVSDDEFKESVLKLQRSKYVENYDNNLVLFDSCFANYILCKAFYSDNFPCLKSLIASLYNNQVGREQLIRMINILFLVQKSNADWSTTVQDIQNGLYDILQHGEPDPIIDILSGFCDFMSTDALIFISDIFFNSVPFDTLPPGNGNPVINSAQLDKIGNIIADRLFSDNSKAAIGLLIQLMSSSSSNCDRCVNRVVLELPNAICEHNFDFETIAYLINELHNSLDSNPLNPILVANTLKIAKVILRNNLDSTSLKIDLRVCFEKFIISMTENVKQAHRKTWDCLDYIFTTCCVDDSTIAEFIWSYLNELMQESSYEFISYDKPYIDKILIPIAKRESIEGLFYLDKIIRIYPILMSSELKINLINNTFYRSIELLCEDNNSRLTKKVTETSESHFHKIQIFLNNATQRELEILSNTYCSLQNLNDSCIWSSTQYFSQILDIVSSKIDKFIYMIKKYYSSTTCNQRIESKILDILEKNFPRSKIGELILNNRNKDSIVFSYLVYCTKFGVTSFSANNDSDFVKLISNLPLEQWVRYASLIYEYCITISSASPDIATKIILNANIALQNNPEEYFEFFSPFFMPYSYVEIKKLIAVNQKLFEYVYIQLFRLQFYGYGSQSVFDYNGGFLNLFMQTDIEFISSIVETIKKINIVLPKIGHYLTIPSSLKILPKTKNGIPLIGTILTIISSTSPNGYKFSFTKSLISSICTKSELGSDPDTSELISYLISNHHLDPVIMLGLFDRIMNEGKTIQITWLLALIDHHPKEDLFSQVLRLPSTSFFVGSEIPLYRKKAEMLEDLSKRLKNISQLSYKSIVESNLRIIKSAICKLEAEDKASITANKPFTRG